MSLLIATVLAAVYIQGANGDILAETCQWNDEKGYCEKLLFTGRGWYPAGSCRTVYMYKYDRYGGFQGPWTQTSNKKNGAYIYTKDKGIYGFWYMWLELSAWGPGWAIGGDPDHSDNYPGTIGWYGWKWGEGLFNRGAFWYMEKNNGGWYPDSDAFMSCQNLCDSDYTCFDAAISSNDVPSNVTNGAGMVSYPPLPEGWNADTVSGDDNILEIVAGAAVGAMAVVVIVIAVLMIRKRKRKRGNGPTSAASSSVHIPEASPTDMAEQIGMSIEAVDSAGTGALETVTGNEAAEVVQDDVAPQMDEVVSVGQEQ